MRSAVFRILRDADAASCSELQALSQSQWQRLVLWLDYSGLALYLFDRLQSAGRDSFLPDVIHARFEQNLSDNFVRTGSLLDESIAIQREFKERQVRYAVLKGLTLWPSSVSKLALRSQLDLDFLVDERSAVSARQILERCGYLLHGASGRSLEFRRNEMPGATLNDLYKDRRSFAVELHIEKAEHGTGQLDRAEWRTLFGFDMPVLSPIDLFLGQGLHVYKHTCAEFMRAAHLWEFRNHLQYRRYDSAFWTELRNAAGGNESVSIRLGIALLMVEHVMGESIPDALAWAVGSVPQAGRLWVEEYGIRSALGSFPGSKRYILLQDALIGAGVTPRRASSKSIFPTRLPPPVVRALPNETIATRLMRYWVQLKFITLRLRFHITAGLDLWHESRHWKSLLRTAADGPNSIRNCQ